MPTSHFTPELFKFLRDLKKNNTRDWFTKNKPRYEEHVKAPLLRFITDLAPRLERISPHFICDPKPVGGSMFRIYRDTRFSKDKSPYKTAATAHFRHDTASDVHCPGFYLHLEPKQVFIGAGIWHPDGPTLQLIRQRLVEDPAGWKRAINAKAFKEGRLALEGESLKRPPRGFDPEHPLVEDLKRKDFIAVARLEEADALSPDFLTTFVAVCRDAKPLVKCLTEACGESF